VRQAGFATGKRFATGISRDGCMHALNGRIATPFAILLLCAACLLVALAADSGRCQKTPSAIEQKIERHRQRIEQGKESLSELSQREEELYSELAGLKDRIEELTSRMRKKEEELRTKKDERRKLRARNRKLVRRIGEKKSAIRDMLAKMWPLYVKNREMGPGQVVDPERVRLNYAWLTRVYSMARDRLASLNAEQNKLNNNLRRMERVKETIAAQLGEIESTKDDLLEQKLAYLDKLQDVRAKRLAKREQLERIREAVGELRYRLKHAKKRRITQLKGRLPWPAKGEVVDVAESERKSGKGLALSLEKGEKVRSVAWGKIVYDDKLRGFGRVVIILHSQNYYSLYAYLLSSQVEMGERIDQGETIGRAGFYPRLKGPGLYFELRRGQRPINPLPWLADGTGRG